MSRFLLASLLVACGATPPRAATPPHSETVPPAERERAADVAGGRVMEGPFADWVEICGPVREVEVPTEDAHHERCSVHVTPLGDGGPFLAIATFAEGSPMGGGGGGLGLQTERGWFVFERPDGEVEFQLSHHTPSSSSFDPAATRFEGGVLRVVSRGSSASFIPGRGPMGSASREWTSVQRCGLRDGAPVCGDGEQVWSRSCHTPDEGGERTCEENGTDIR